MLLAHIRPFLARLRRHYRRLSWPVLRRRPLCSTECYLLPSGQLVRYVRHQATGQVLEIPLTGATKNGALL